MRMVSTQALAPDGETDKTLLLGGSAVRTLAPDHNADGLC